jgi:hypothetical protein
VVAVVDGDVVVAVTATGTVDLGGGPTSASGDGVSIALARFDASGDYVWQRRFAGAGAETPTALEVLSDGDLLLVGHFADGLALDSEVANAVAGRDAFVARLDGDDGAPLWLSVLGGAGDQQIRDAAVLPGGRIAVIGDFDIELVADVSRTTPGDVDAFVAELDVDTGVVASSFVLSSSADEWGQQIASAATGEVLVAGEYETTLDLGGVPLPNASQLEVFLARLHLDDGDPTWATSLGGNNFQYARTLDVRGERAVLGGGFQSELRYDRQSVIADYQAQQFLAVANLADGARVSAAGYAQVANGDRGKRVISAAIDAAGHVAAAGWFEGVANVGGEMFTSRNDDLLALKVADDGTVFWARAFGGTGFQRAHDAGVDGEEIVLVGSFEGEITIADTHDCPATSCAVLARLAK